MEAQPAQGWWQASDGRWYPPGAASPDVIVPPSRQRWWESTAFVLVMLLLCSIPGLVLVWVKRQWGLGIKLLLTALTVGLLVLGVKLQDDLRVTRSAAPRAAAVTDGRLTRFGATEADWYANHVANPFDLTTWDLDPRLAGGRSARYPSVGVAEGRVASLELQLPDGTSTDQALAEVLIELPPDTTILWRVDGATCVSVSAESTTLAQAATSSVAGVPGRVLITLETRSIFDRTLDSRNVNHAGIVVADAPTPNEVGSLCPE